VVLPLSSRLHAWGRLLRVSLFATAFADPVVGGLLAGGEPSPRAALAPLASLCVYHGAMALNDLADREQDRVAGRARPLLDGSIAPGAAGLVVVLLLGTGLGLAWLAGGSHGLAWLGAAAGVAVAYDLAGRGPVLGPLLLALARGCNLLFGAACAGWAAGAGSLGELPALAALAYGTYVFVVSRLGRMEDGEDGAELGGRPARLLRLLAGLLVAGPVLVGLVAWLRVRPDGLAWLPALLGLGLGLVHLRRSAAPLLGAASRPGWTPAAVEQVMGLALSRLLPLTVGCLLLARADFLALLAAGLLLGLGLAGRRLMATFPPS
jgi:4-hydroxybenzoate polyprenyltransferase